MAGRLPPLPPLRRWAVRGLAAPLLVLGAVAAVGLSRSTGTSDALSVGHPVREAQLPPTPALEQSAFRVLVFSRTAGFRHDSIADGVAAIQALGAEHGFGVDATEDPTLFHDEVLAAYQAVIFLSTTGDVLDAQQEAAFERYIRRGNGFVGIHAASDTEYDWPWYGGLVGAYFHSHPAIQLATVHVEDHDHPSTRALPEAWRRTDEWYNFHANPRAAPGMQVLARLDGTSYAGGSMGKDHPIAWLHVYEGGRAWYTGGGHTRESFSEPLFLQHILGGIQYAAGMPAPPPPGAVILFDGTDASAQRWQQAGGGPLRWRIVDGSLEVLPGSGDARTVEAFGDFRLHLDLRVPATAEGTPEQDRGNSGVYLQQRYELQVLDSFGRELGGLDDAGAVYGLKDADVQASLPPGVWQTYDVVFRAARWAGEDPAKVADARVTVRWNGVLVHADVALPRSTPGGAAEDPGPGPLLLQDHGQPVQFRNIWLEPLD